ncbi:MAG TPA: ATP-binding protein [Stellaceae bacterium]|jgi:signal transduction histidine kinase|nr:ATP-binding protein [Stellaceae bacterium]
MPPNRPESHPAATFSCQRCTTVALAVVLIGAFLGLAAADRSERFAAAAREHDAIVAGVVGSVASAFDQDTRLLDRLAADPDGNPFPRDTLNIAVSLVPGVEAAAILDRDGAVQTIAPAGPAGRALDTIAAEAKTRLSAPDAPALYISGPMHDSDRGLDVIGLARARRDGDGRVAGFALVAIDAASLALPQSLPQHGTLAIRRDDGVTLFRSGDGSAAGTEAAVPAYPLGVSFGRPGDEIWRGWRAVWLRNGAFVGLAGLVAALAAALWDRRRRRAAARRAESQAREAATLRQNVAELAAAAKDADEASRAKSRFFAQVTHELRTPLNAIIGFSETIHCEMFGPVANPRYVEYAGLIHDAGGHLLSLINDLLDVSKLEEGKMEIAPIRVSAAALARSTLDLVELLAREGDVALAAGGVDTCPDLTVDPRAAKQVLVNLLSNAIKFTPAGGRIDFGFAGRADGGVAITVADTGIGMSSEDIRLAFEPFGRAPGELAAAAPGTGLGLPIARALVRLHGGELSLTSTPGRGTIVTVVFPADAVAAPRPLEAVSPARAA